MKLTLEDPYSETHIGTIFGKIIDDLNIIRSYIDGVDSTEYAHNTMLQDSINMRIVDIGSLLKDITGSRRGKDKYGLLSELPEIDWIGLKGMRDRTAHAYHNCDLSHPWDCVTEDLPKLEDAIYAVCDNYPKIKKAMEVTIENINFERNREKEKFLNSFLDDDQDDDLDFLA